MDLAGCKYLVVGAGFFGSVIAERIAADLGERVLVIDRRDHAGGNSFSSDDRETGIECHRYGSHIFHAADAAVWDYVNRFSAFNSYRHRVLATYCGAVYQMPINLATINQFYGKNLTPAEAVAFIRSETAKEGITAPANLEEKAVSLIGRPLYEAFIRGYTVKQWGVDPATLPESIIDRLPVRYTYKSDYFNDPWQGIPLGGYHRLFHRLLNHANIEVSLKTDYIALRDRIPPGCTVIFTGPIDRFFDYRFGRLGWRSLRFEKEICRVGDYQGTSVMNYCESAVPFTRIHEFRHYHEERNYPKDATVIYREYSLAGESNDDPAYPVNTAKDQELFARYAAEAANRPNVIFGGRLGSYQYLDMDKTIAMALSVYAERIRPRGKRS